MERANLTLQDRLLKELRLEHVCDLEAGNAFLPGFVERLNKLFARKPAAPADFHRRVTDLSRLNDVLSQCEQRHVSEQLTLSYDRKQLILERNKVSEELGGKYVEVYAFPDGWLEVRSNAHVLPYRVFNKDQRVSPTAIVERKRLSHALSIIKAKQEAMPVPKVQTNSEKNGYRKKGRMIYGAPPATDTIVLMGNGKRLQRVVPECNIDGGEYRCEAHCPNVKALYSVRSAR